MTYAQKIISLKSAVLASELLELRDKEPVLAVTNSFVSYHNADGKNIELSPGTALLVDEVRGIALFGDDHFEIWPVEYTIVEV